MPFNILPFVAALSSIKVSVYLSNSESPRPFPIFFTLPGSVNSPHIVPVESALIVMSTQISRKTLAIGLHRLL